MIKNIGRNKKNDIIINDPKISNFHAQIIIDGSGKIFINDLQSENGTYVNKKIINEPTELRSNDQVKLASVAFNWKEFINNENKKDQIAVPTKVESKNNLLIYLITLVIILLTAIGIFVLNEYNFSNNENSIENIDEKNNIPLITTDSEEDDSNTDITNSENEVNQQVESIQDNAESTHEDREITYDYSCLEDEKDLGTTGLINVFSEIGDQLIEENAEEVTLKEEIDYAKESHQIMKENYNFIYDQRHKKLVEILKKLTNKINSSNNYNYKVFLVKDETINAYTTGGGYIYVFEGMYDYLKSDDEIAAILAHEIQHNELGHIKDYHRVQKTNNTFFGEFGHIVTSIQSIATMNFNQLKESQCDLNGIDLCSKANYKLCATSNIWKRMKEDEEEFNTLNNLLRTHPYSVKRQNCASNHIQNNYNINCEKN